MTAEPDGDQPPPLDVEPSAGPSSARRGGARHLQASILAGGCVAIVAVNLYFIQRGPVHGAAAPGSSAPVASSAAPPPERDEDAAPPLAGTVAANEPALEADAGPPPQAEDPPPEEPPPPPEKPADRKGIMTVEQAVKRACSTAPIEGLSRQIVAEARCLDANAFTRVPARRNLETSGHVFLYLDAPARDHLLRVLDAHPNRTMKVHSALRTVAQQYLLSRWAAAKRCGIQLATKPGESNHETGLALDVSEPGTWRPALESEGFRWLGKIDRVHFDFVGPGATHHTGLDVQAFQRLWNRNHPDDAIAESGRYDVATEIRLKRSPAEGFAIGARCGGGRNGRPARAAASPR